MNTKPLISIIVPSIRVENLPSIYNSITLSTKENFEVIIAGPFLPPKELENKHNIKYIKDWGSPVRAAAIASSFAEGELITWSSDDALFLPEALDKFLECTSQADIIVAKYLEGINGTTKQVQGDRYFSLNGSEATRSPLFRDDWWLFNVGIMPTDLFHNIGGWSCEFEGTFFSHSDLAVRCYMNNNSVHMSNVFLLDCDHSQKDHKPIEIAQVYFDMPYFLNKYKTLDMSYIINKNTWKDSPSVWDKRFKNG